MKIRDNPFYVPSLYLPFENPRSPQVPSSTALEGARARRGLQRVYNELFRALAWKGRDTELLSLWQEAETCTLFKFVD